MKSSSPFRPVRSRVSALALLLAAPFSALLGAGLSYHDTAPSPSPYDVANLVGAARDRDNIGGDGMTDGDANDHSTYVSGLDRPHQGQTFTTGDNPAGYRVHAIWLRHAGYTANQSLTWWCLPAGGNLTVRLTRPAAAGTFAFALASEPVLASGAEPGAPNELSPVSTRVNTVNGTGLWMRFALSSPVALYPNTRYGFDLSAHTPEFFFELLGLRDNSAEGDAYPGGSAYLGSTIGAADQTLRPLAGDRVFVVEMSPAIEVVRDGRDVFLSWARIGGTVSRIDLLRNERATSEGRQRVASFTTPTQFYLDQLPAAETVCWYWLLITRPDGSTESIGPVAGRSAPVWTP